MAHQYRQRIAVTFGVNGEPGGFVWRGTTYSVVGVLARWHLRDRWWEMPDPTADRLPDLPPGRRSGERRASTTSSAPIFPIFPSGAVASDRHYFRLECAEGLLCEVYWDAVDGAWTLDRVLD